MIGDITPLPTTVLTWCYKPNGDKKVSTENNFYSGTNHQCEINNHYQIQQPFHQQCVEWAEQSYQRNLIGPIFSIVKPWCSKVLELLMGGPES